MGFVTKLQVAKHYEPRRAWERAQWRLLNELVFVSNGSLGVITVPVGFVTDYASVPRLLLTFALFGDVGHEAAVVHDWLYCDPAVARRDADGVFYEALCECGTPVWRAAVMWLAVRLCGWLVRGRRLGA